MIPLLLAVVAAVACAPLGNALYFFLDNSQERCFLEDLPANVKVFAKYKSAEWSQVDNTYLENFAAGIQVVVKEVENGHVIKNIRGGSSGQFSFTAQDSGEHEICLSSNHTTWMGNVRTRLHFDVNIGDDHDEGSQNEVIFDLAYKIRELNSRAASVRREQQQEKEREAMFRNLSERVNSHVIWWSLMQIAVLTVAGIWQTRHLRHFFEVKKLV